MYRNRSHISVDTQAVHVQFNAPPAATSLDLAELVSLVPYPVLSKRIGLNGSTLMPPTTRMLMIEGHVIFSNFQEPEPLHSSTAGLIKHCASKTFPSLNHAYPTR